MKAEIIRKELEAVRRKNGGILTAEKVIKAASNKSSPLHSCFEWDDAAAAHKHRLEQAESLIRRYRIEEKKVTPQRVEITYGVPEYSQHPGLSNGYARTFDLMNGADKPSLLAQEHQRLIGHVDRFAGYLRMDGWHAEADQLQALMVEIGNKVRLLASAVAGN